MTISEEWNEFLENMLNNATEKYRQSNEYHLWKQRDKQRDKQIDETLKSMLSDKDFMTIQEFLFETIVASPRETEVIYNQGFKDCILILKNIGVIT